MSVCVVMPNPRTAAEWAKIEARHVKVEDVIFDRPVCRTCRYIDGVAVAYPCDAAIILAYARQRVETWQVNVRTEKLPCGHPTFYMCGQGACGFCAEIAEQVAAFRERLIMYLRMNEHLWPEREAAIRALP